MGNNKLLNDVASILAEVGVSYGVAESIAEVLVEANLLDENISDGWVDKASNATIGGECSC